MKIAQLQMFVKFNFFVRTEPVYFVFEFSASSPEKIGVFFFILPKVKKKRFFFVEHCIFDNCSHVLLKILHLLNS